MHEVMKTVLMLSMSGTLLAGILLICRPLYVRRLSRRWQYYIWLVVIARLLVPWSFEICPAGETIRQNKIFDHIAEYFKTMSIVQSEDGTLEPENTSAQDSSAEKQKDAGNGTAEKTQQNADISKESKQAGKIGNSKELVQSEEKGSHALELAKNTGAKIILILVKYLPEIWLVTAMLLLFRKITIYQSFVKYIRAGSRAVENIQLMEHVGTMIEQNHWLYKNGSIEICTNSLISSPLLIGILKPCIVLPESEYFLAETGFHYTVLHELTHLRRGDLIYKWLVQAAVCLHWFNPFVYRMEQAVSRECELSCDEAVIQRLDDEARKEYGSILLNAMAAGTYAGPAVSVSFNEGKKLLKGRLDAIMNYKKKTKAAAAASIALTCLFAAGAASLGISKPMATTGDEIVRTGTAKQDDLPIICEGGNVYYVFAEGADASDKPSGGVTDGAISIDYVCKDGYSSAGPFSKKKKLIKEVKSQCTYGMKHGMCTQEEYDAFLYAAQEIDRISKTDSDKFPKLNKDSITLTEGSTKSLQLKQVKEAPVWSSNKSKVASVGTDGKVTAKSPGKTNICAKIGNITYVCKVNVVKKAASKKAVTKKDYAKDYPGCGITKKNGSYYYTGDRIRIFMDVKADGSFVRFHYDQNGTVDLRIRRAEDGSVLKIENIQPAEAIEIQEELELPHFFGIGNTASDSIRTDDTDTGSLDLRKAYQKKTDVGSYAKIVRLTKEEAPAKIKQALQTCRQGQWYVISRKKKQYIYCNGLPADYAFQSELDRGSLNISIFDIGRTSGCYVLLSVRKNTPMDLAVYYNGKSITYEKIDVS